MGPRKYLPDIMGEAIGRMQFSSQQAPRPPVPSPDPPPEPEPPPAQPPAKVLPMHGEDGNLARELVQRLKSMRLSGMAQALSQQIMSPESSEASFESRLAALLEQEEAERGQRRLLTRLRRAGLPVSPRLSEVDYSQPRGLNAKIVDALARGSWIERQCNLIIIGPTGVGKTFVACALLRQACVNGVRTRYLHLGRLLAELESRRGSDRLPRYKAALSRLGLLALDDWGLAEPSQRQCLDLLEVLEQRQGQGATVVISQLPPEYWTEMLGFPIVAQAIVDRLVAGAVQIRLYGDSLRTRFGTHLD